MAQFTSVAVQTVAPGGNFILTDSDIQCRKGYVLHREGSGILTLRGVSNGCNGFARYRVSFGNNIAIPTDGAVEPISVALAIDGEAIESTRAIITPAAVGAYWNVSRSCYITVPAGCCYVVALENTSAQEVNGQNLIITVDRTA